MKLFPLLMLAFSSVIWLSGHLRANDVSAENLTVARSAFFGGVTSFGYADGGVAGAGYTIDLYSGTTTIQHEQVIPGYMTSETTWEDVWGWVSSEPQQVWVEEYGPTVEQVWVDDYGMVETPVWNEDTFDEQGNLIEAGHWSMTSSYEIIGGHWEEVPGWGVIGGHYETVTGDPVWSVVDTIQHVTQTWVPEQHNSYTETVSGVPVIRQTGTAANSVWKWRNQERELMELSPAGLSIPAEGLTAGLNRAVLTSSMLEQSYATPSGAAEYLSYGVKLQKDGVEAWRDSGTNATVQMSETLKLRPSEVLLKEEVPITGTNTVATRTTRVGVNSSRFGGLVEVAGDVKVQGVLRVKPSGDLLMGPYTSGQQP